MTNIHAEQNLRLAQKMLAQQGEINALAAALGALTHEFDPTPSTACEACFRPSAHPVHRTPARVRAELERP